MDKMTVIVGVLALLVLGYAWYTERTRRRDAELERDVATRRTALDATTPKLEENKKNYDKALGELNAIPPHMLDNVGKTLPLTGAPQRASVEPVDPRFHRPGLDGPSPAGKA